MTDATDKVRNLFTRVHSVAPNDTLATIAKNFYGDEKFADDLARVNGVASNAILTIGRRIKVPPLAKLTQPIVQRIGALADGNDFPVQDTPPIVATRPFYMNPMFYAGLTAGAALAYILLEYVLKSKKRK